MLPERVKHFGEHPAGSPRCGPRSELLVAVLSCISVINSRPH